MNHECAAGHFARGKRSANDAPGAPLFERKVTPPWPSAHHAREAVRPRPEYSRTWAPS